MHDINTASSNPDQAIGPMVFMCLYPDGSFGLAERTDNPHENQLAVAEVVGGGAIRLAMPGVDAYINELHQLDPDLEPNPYASRVHQAATGTTDTLSGPIVFVGRSIDGVDAGISLWLASELLNFVHLVNSHAPGRG